MDDSRIASATLDPRIGQVSLNGRQPRKIMYRQTTDDCRSHDFTCSLARCIRVGAGISAERRRRATSVIWSDGDTGSLVAEDSAVD